MKLISWTDPRYFRFASALIRSIRYHENDNDIVLYLLDFNEEQTNEARELFRYDSKLEFKNLYSDNTDNYTVKTGGKKNEDAPGKIQFYRNFRPRMFLNELKSAESEKICTFGANGLVFTSLDYIEDLLDVNDFVFMEREKENVMTEAPKTVKCIEDIADLVTNQNIDIDSILGKTTGKIVLLGTHAMKQSPVTYSILERWIELIENTDAINTKFSDMNLFVKAYTEALISGHHPVKKETGLSLPRDKNPFCDTSFNDGNKIWFAKGDTKWKNSKYIEKVAYFLNHEYGL